MGLLSIGEEKSKGNELTLADFPASEATAPELSWGTWKGATCTTAEVDVIVADGFAGNVALKISEA